MADLHSIAISAVEQGVVTIALNRPDKKNPIGPQTCGELYFAIEQCRLNRECRAILLTGNGGVFSAGGDLSAMAGASAASGGVPPASLVDLLVRMHQCGKPIIAKVPGPALAGGLGLMVACDLVVAADTAVFGTTEIAVGLWPMMITAELVRNVGRKKTLEMMLTGRKLTAAEALDCGLVNWVVSPEQLDVEATRIARHIASRSPAAIALGLRAFYATQDMEFGSQLKHLETELGNVLALDDAREGIAAFLQKRQPVWSGK